MLHTMKISPDQLNSIITPSVLQLADIFSRNNHEIRIAGGAVRDLLMEKVPHDLDFATTATPEEMKLIFEKENLRIINLGGEKHGTITVRIGDANFECTTLRIDVVTDGRHAEVQFTKDWALDAGRRDLTVNAMFLGLDGTVYDYFNGEKDTLQRQVKFVGDAQCRIREDYLRILRYFRFYGRVAKSPNEHNPEVLKVISENVQGLQNISGERLWMELQQIVTGRFGGELLVSMVSSGVGKYLSFPDNFDCDNLLRVFSQCQVHFPVEEKVMHHMTLLASGFRNLKCAEGFLNRIKCSRKEREVFTYVVHYRPLAYATQSFKEIQDLLVDLVVLEKRNYDVAEFYVKELLKYTCRLDYLQELETWKVPKFPVNGLMIIENGFQKRQVKIALEMMVETWKNSNFTISSEDLLTSLDREKIVQKEKLMRR